MDMARKFIKSAYLPKVHLGQVLTEAQINTLRDAVDRPDARLPLDSVDFGTGFAIYLGKIHIHREALADTQNRNLQAQPKLVCSRRGVF